MAACCAVLCCALHGSTNQSSITRCTRGHQLQASTPGGGPRAGTRTQGRGCRDLSPPLMTMFWPQGIQLNCNVRGVWQDACLARSQPTRCNGGQPTAAATGSGHAVRSWIVSVVWLCSSWGNQLNWHGRTFHNKEPTILIIYSTRCVHG